MKPSNYKSDETSEDDAAVKQLLTDLFSKISVNNDIKDTCQILWEAERRKPKLPYANGRIEPNIDYKVRSTLM